MFNSSNTVAIYESGESVGLYFSDFDSLVDAVRDNCSALRFPLSIVWNEEVYVAHIVPTVGVVRESFNYWDDGWSSEIDWQRLPSCLPSEVMSVLSDAASKIRSSRDDFDSLAYCVTVYYLNEMKEPVFYAHFPCDLVSS